MKKKFSPGQAQDRVYSIGGGSFYSEYEDDAIENIVMGGIAMESEDGLVEQGPVREPEEFVIPEVPDYLKEPEVEISVQAGPEPWYWRLWKILLMDVRDVWAMIWKRQ